MLKADLRSRSPTARSSSRTPTSTPRCAPSPLPLPLSLTICQIFISRILAHNDQQCSIYLQQRVKIATTDERRVPIYTAVGSSLRELCLNKFGASLSFRDGDDLFVAHSLASRQLPRFALHRVRRDRPRL